MPVEEARSRLRQAWDKAQVALGAGTKYVVVDEDVLIGKNPEPPFVGTDSQPIAVNSFEELEKAWWDNFGSAQDPAVLAESGYQELLDKYGPGRTTEWATEGWPGHEPEGPWSTQKPPPEGPPAATEPPPLAAPEPPETGGAIPPATPIEGPEPPPAPSNVTTPERFQEGRFERDLKSNYEEATEVLGHPPDFLTPVDPAKEAAIKAHVAAGKADEARIKAEVDAWRAKQAGLESGPPAEVETAAAPEPEFMETPVAPKSPKRKHKKKGPPAPPPVEEAAAPPKERQPWEHEGGGSWPPTYMIDEPQRAALGVMDEPMTPQEYRRYYGAKEGARNLGVKPEDIRKGAPGPSRTPYRMEEALMDELMRQMMEREP
jgi:hypothetical protein